MDPYLATTFEQEILKGSDGMSAMFDIGAVQVNRDQQLAGFMLVMSAPRVDISAPLFKQMRKGLEEGGTRLKRRDIQGTAVYFTPEEATALVRLRGDLVFMVGLNPAATRGIAKAIVAANT